MTKQQMIYFTVKNNSTNGPIENDSVKIINEKLNFDTTITGNSFDLSILTESEGQSITILDPYIFIGYANGFRRDTIDTIPEEDKTYEFEYVKLEKFEFNDWSIYLSSMSFLTINREYWPTGNPPNQGMDSNIYNGGYETNVIDYNKSYFQNFWCYDGDADMLKYEFHHCNSTNSFKNSDFWDNYITLNIYFDIDTLNNVIRKLKLVYQYYGEDYLGNNYYKELSDDYYFILENIPFTINSDGSIFSEVKKIDYQIKFKNFDNYYRFHEIKGMSGNNWRSKYIDWVKLSMVRNDTFFRLVLSK